MRITSVLVVFLWWCSACVPLVVELPPHELLYQDDNWIVDTVPFTTGRSCLVAARDESRTGSGLMIYAIRDAPTGSAVVRIELLNPPSEYLDPNRTTTILVDLGPSFTRRMEFSRLPGTRFQMVAASLGREDLNSVAASLRPSGGIRSLTFQNGTTWRFPAPRNSDLALRASECWRQAGIST